MIEQALVFSCAGEHLMAVLTPAQSGAPASAALADLGVVIIVGGPQYRAGSHRQYVQLARSLALQGVTAMRFDARGMGDSSGAQRSMEEIDADVGAALDALQASRPGLRRVVLWGLCGGATTALLYWRNTHDQRVQGMVLVNPWVRSEQTLARTHLKHYYLKRLGERAFWAKLFSGQVAGKAVADLLHNLRLARKVAPVRPTAAVLEPHHPVSSSSQLVLEVPQRPLQQRMAQAWQHFQGPKLLVLSGNDYTAKEFIETAATDALWRANLERAEVTRFDVNDADHTFSDPSARLAVEARTLSWLMATLGPDLNPGVAAAGVASPADSLQTSGVG